MQTYTYTYTCILYIYINIYIYTYSNKRPHVTDNDFDTYIFQHFSTCAHGQTGWIGADLPIQWFGIADHLPALRGVEPSRKPRRLGTPLFSTRGSPTNLVNPMESAMQITAIVAIVTIYLLQ